MSRIQNEAWWINLAYSVRRSEGIEQAEAILLRARAIHPKVAMIAFNLAATRASPVAWRTPRSAFGMRSSLIRTFGYWRSTMKICDLSGIGLLGCSSHKKMAEAPTRSRAL